jgi:hypothetical protein
MLIDTLIGSLVIIERRKNKETTNFCWVSELHKMIPVNHKGGLTENTS